MSCFRTPQLTEIELLMALDGEADPELTMHIAQCPDCRARGEQLQAFDHRLSHRLFRATCPPSVELGEYHLGFVPTATSAAIKHHLAECPFCSQELAQLAAYMDQPDPFLRSDPLGAVKRSVKFLVGRLTSGPTVHNRIGGPAFAPALAGLRGALDSPLIYEVDDIQVTLEVQDDAALADRKAVIGLIVGIGEMGGLHAELWHDGEHIAGVPLDEIGNFAFNQLIPAEYELFISGNDLDVHIESLSLVR